MARRIEIELTSARPDGSWTWRAAGARQPRGVLDGGLLPGGAKAGDVLKAEAEFEIEGITIVSVTAPKETTRSEPERIEIIGSGRPDAPGVTTQLVGRADRRPGERRRERDDARPRRDREGGRPPLNRDTTRPRREGPAADGEHPGRRPSPAGRDDRPDGATPAGRPERSERPGRSDRPERAGRPERPARAAASPRPSRPATGDRPGGAGREERAGRGERAARGEREAGSDATGERRARRFNPGRAHRQAVMASLPPEEQPIAEQVLRGGIPAVRTALHLEREKAIGEGRPAPHMDQLVAMAEALLPRLKAAEWHDRAEAAAKDVEDISLRDLRSVVAGSDVARDDETRALAATLREALDRRVDTLRQQWSGEVAKHLDENRVVRALRLAGRPPEPAARLEAGLTERLSDAAAQAMAPDTPADRWLALIDAVAASPVRRTVKPVGLPTDPSPELRRAAQQQSGRIPALAAMLGIAIPPPPAPIAGRRAPTPPKPDPAPVEMTSAEGGQDPVVVEELGEAFGER